VANTLVVIRGGGDLGSGVAHRLLRARYAVVILEVEQPTVIRRRVAFASAIYDGEIFVEGVKGLRVADAPTALWAVSQGMIPVLVDPNGHSLSALHAAALVDARLAKRNLGTHKTDAPVVIGLGPGFVAGADVHAVIETQRGHDLGRVIYAGTALADTGLPGNVGGEDARRLLRAPVAGVFHAGRAIGSPVKAGDVVGFVGDSPVLTYIDGVLRGIIHDGVAVPAGLKIGDVDPRGTVEHCFTISDKARAIGGGVLEALLRWRVLPDARTTVTLLR
jgi:xanthine dehydrogenase accessory factor